MRLLAGLVLVVSLLTHGALAAMAQSPQSDPSGGPAPGGQPGSGTAPSSDASALPVPTPDDNGVLVLNNDDNGMTVQLSTGQTVTLQLAAGEGLNLWQVDPPDPTVLSPMPNGAAAAMRGVTLRSFAAVGSGTTQITATDAPNCPTGEACPQFLLGFQVTVVVTDPSS